MGAVVKRRHHAQKKGYMMGHKEMETGEKVAAASEEMKTVVKNKSGNEEKKR